MEDGQRHAPSIGIDLGTTCIRVAVFDGSQCRIILDEHGYSAMPFYVAFTDSGVLVGEAARRQAPNNPTNTVFDVTCLIGRRYSDSSVKNVTRQWPFKVIASQDDGFLVVVPWKSKPWHFTPVQIFSMILMQVRENAKKNLGTTITNAVITVPFHFNYKQRQAINEAGMIAGLNFMRIISAPAASALFYGIEKQQPKIWTPPWNRKSEHHMIIYHVGEGTLDVVLATIKDSQCIVRAAAGNLHLGGLNFDNTTADYFVSTLTVMCLKDANMSANIVHEVILAGGSRWNPLLKPYILHYFKHKELNVREQLETTPAYGAAIQAFFCDNREACCLSLLDVTPFSLGIQYPRGEMAVCIPKNTPFPTKMNKTFQARNRTTELFFEVYEDELIIKNNLLGKFELTQVPKMCHFNILFEIHENGTLTVMAEEISTRQRKGIMIIDNNIEHSRMLVQEAFRYQESPKGINKASTTKILTRSGSSSTSTSTSENEKIVISKENGSLTTEEIQKMMAAAACYKAHDEEHKARAAGLNSQEDIAYRNMADMVIANAQELVSSENNAHKMKDKAREPVSNENSAHKMKAKAQEPVSNENSAHQEPVSNETIAYKNNATARERITIENIAYVMKAIDRDLSQDK